MMQFFLVYLVRFQRQWVFSGIGRRKGIDSDIILWFSGYIPWLSGTLVQYHEIDADQASILDLDGTSAAFTTISGSTITIHSTDTDKATVNDLDGTSATFSGVISGSTVDAHA